MRMIRWRISWLRGGQAVVDGQTILAAKMRDDCIAVTDNLIVGDDVRKLPAGCGGCVENVLVIKRHLGQLEESKHF